LLELAELTGLGYARLQSSTDVAGLLQGEQSSRTLAVPVDVRTPLAALALALLVFAIDPIRRLPWQRAQLKWVTMSPDHPWQRTQLKEVSRQSATRSVAGRRQIASHT
jgi:hypothetical protein